MKTLEKTTNQHALVIRLLIEHYSEGVTMADAMREYYFHKFQSRLCELEIDRAHKLKIRRLPIVKKNRFGHVMTFLNYKSVASKNYLINLHNKLCREGVKKQKQANCRKE